MITGETYTVHIGNNLDILPTLADNSVDSIVTDPPYELGFMGKKWDNSGIAYSVELWRECLRVLKPGGHLLSFGGTRTWHRVAVGIEDAGFEVRDSIAWLYGSGFPKSLDISKAIDKQAGAEREVLTEVVSDLFGDQEVKQERKTGIGTGKGSTAIMGDGNRDLTMPATHKAQQWQGWGTALKPAFEPIVVARKPLIGTVAANVLQHGTGALNIDGSRIGTGADRISGGGVGKVIDNKIYGGFNMERSERPVGARWPANVILDEYSAELLDQQSGLGKSAKGKVTATNTGNSTWAADDGGNFDVGRTRDWEGYGDTGGASRFFYVAKASKRDRNEGLDGLDERQSVGGGGGVGDYLDDVNSASGKFGSEKAPGKNFHPTVKPTQLMRYLVKLVTPPGGTVLDPFTGSGSTGKAAILEGFKFIGCELTEDYIPIIEGRLKHAELMKAEEEAKQKQALF
jgi:site-specific DNA-methyltransferase (adenine-specific)